MIQTSEPLLSLRGITKRYGGVLALNAADIDIAAGRIHAVLGENGAGKSTLIKIMSGVVMPDEGSMTLAGTTVQPQSPAQANSLGIACVFQELSLVPDLSVADNILARNPPQRFGLIDRSVQRMLAKRALAEAGAPDIHPSSLVRDLPLSRRQMVEIAKALIYRPRVLILDEATSALTAADVERTFAVIRALREKGTAIVYISHKMREIEELADDCTIFRNGSKIATFPVRSKTHKEMVELMIGREYKNTFPPKPAKQHHEKPRLQCEGLGWNNQLKNISFDVKPGEIIGLGGLDGQGQKELLLCLFGVMRGVDGKVMVDGRPFRPTSPRRAKKPDIAMALVPEDRKTEGLMLSLSIKENAGFSSLDRISSFGIMQHAREDEQLKRLVQLLQIKVADADLPVSSLSGGNQQKVVIAKWLANNPKIVLLNDPTRGIDVGTKQELYVLLRKLAESGTSIVFYTTDYAELIGCCDRVLVMYNGQIVKELDGAQITEHNLISSALNIAEGTAA
jgi:ribose transport system ATP-binding protein